MKPFPMYRTFLLGSIIGLTLVFSAFLIHLRSEFANTNEHNCVCSTPMQEQHNQFIDTFTSTESDSDSDSDSEQEEQQSADSIDANDSPSIITSTQSASLTPIISSDNTKQHEEEGGDPNVFDSKLLEYCLSSDRHFFEFALVPSAGLASELNQMMWFYHAIRLSSNDNNKNNVEFYVDTMNWNYGILWDIIDTNAPFHSRCQASHVRPLPTCDSPHFLQADRPIHSMTTTHRTCTTRGHWATHSFGWYNEIDRGRMESDIELKKSYDQFWVLSKYRQRINQDIYSSYIPEWYSRSFIPHRSVIQTNTKYPTIALHFRRGDKLVESPYHFFKEYRESIYRAVNKLVEAKRWDQQDMDEYKVELQKKGQEFSAHMDPSTISTFLSLRPPPLYLFIVSDDASGVLSEVTKEEASWPFISLSNAHATTIFANGFNEGRLNEAYEKDYITYSRPGYRPPSSFSSPNMLPIQRHTALLVAELEILRSAEYVIGSTRTNMASFIQRIRPQPSDTFLTIQ